MQINILLKSGVRLQIMDATEKDYISLTKTLCSWKRFFSWNDRAIVRKSEIAFIELIPNRANEEKICASDIQEMERTKNMMNHEHFEQTI